MLPVQPAVLGPLPRAQQNAVLLQRCPPIVLLAVQHVSTVLGSALRLVDRALLCLVLPDKFTALSKPLLVHQLLMPMATVTKINVWKILALPTLLAIVISINVLLLHSNRRLESAPIVAFQRDSKPQTLL